MKNIATILLLTVCVTISAITIDNITDITNERLLQSFNSYSGSVFRYEDRIIISNFSSIEEFEIIEDGKLNRILLYETLGRSDIHIDGDRLYALDNASLASEDLCRFTVFDLSQKPMESIATFNIPLRSNTAHHVMFTDEHILLRENTYINNAQRRVLINKSTYNVDGYNTEINTSYTTLSENKLVQNNGFNTFVFYTLSYNPDINNYHINEESRITINHSLGETRHLEFLDDKLVITKWNGVAIVDVTDITNPQILHQFLVDSRSDLTYSLFVDNYLFVSNANGDLFAFEVVGQNEINLQYQDTGINAIGPSMHYQYPYLYMNKNYGFKVYDVSDNFKTTFVHGVHYCIYSMSENDMYYAFFDADTYYNQDRIEKWTVCSVFDDDIVFRIEYVAGTRLLGYYIHNNRLYAIVYNNVTTEYALEVYDLNDGQAMLSNSIPLSHGSYDLQIINNRLYIPNSSTFSVAVYDINDTDISYVGNFDGHISARHSGASNKYILNYYGNRFRLRDSNDFNNIILDKGVFSGFDSILHHNDNHFWLSTLGNRNSVIYNFDIDNDAVTSALSVSDAKLSSYNNVFSKYYTATGVSEYYSLINKQMQKIGEKQDNRAVEWTYFFPKRNKMVQRATSGLWVYDIEYTTVSEDDIVISRAETGLLGNYPNPFNPSTSVQWSVASVQNVVIEIFNVRGQKVRTLVNGEFGAGEHTVVWNGLSDDGQPVGSGVYFYRMRAVGFVETRRMLLLK